LVPTEPGQHGNQDDKANGQIKRKALLAACRFLMIEAKH